MPNIKGRYDGLPKTLVTPLLNLKKFHENKTSYSKKPATTIPLVSLWKELTNKMLAAFQILFK